MSIAKLHLPGLLVVAPADVGADRGVFLGEEDDAAAVAGEPPSAADDGVLVAAFALDGVLCRTAEPEDVALPVADGVDLDTVAVGVFLADEVAGPAALDLGPTGVEAADFDLESAVDVLLPAATVVADVGDRGLTPSLGFAVFDAAAGVAAAAGVFLLAAVDAGAAEVAEGSAADAAGGDAGCAGGATSG